MKLQLQRLNTWQICIVFVLLAAFFEAMHVTNRFEAWDTAPFSASAEVFPYWATPDARMMAFYHLYRAVFHSIDSLGFNLNVYTILGTFGALLSAGAIFLLYRLLKKGFGLSDTSSLFGALTLGATYGFLRYASEIEVYSGSAFLILAGLNIIFDAFARPQLSLAKAALIGAICGLGVCFYQPIAFPLFFGAFVLFAANGRWKEYIAYGAAGVAVYFACLTIIVALENGRFPGAGDYVTFFMERTEEFYPPGLTWVSFVKAAQAIIHDFSSLTWLYAMPGVEARIASFQPQHYYFGEEIFYAAQHSELKWVAPITFTAVALAFCYLVFLAWRTPSGRRIDARVGVVIVWILVSAITNMILNPGERETWINCLPAIAILLAVFVYEPLRNRPNLLAVSVGLLLLHNIVGGIAIYKSRAGDLYAGRTEWVRDHGERGDWILTTGAPVDWFNKMRLLRYPIAKKPNMRLEDEFFNFMYFDGDIATEQHWRHGPPLEISTREMLRRLKETGGRVYMFDAAIDPRAIPPRLSANDRDHKLRSFGRFLAKYAKVVDDGPYGKTYELDKAKLPLDYSISQN